MQMLLTQCVAACTVYATSFVCVSASHTLSAQFTLALSYNHWSIQPYLLSTVIFNLRFSFGR
eukprot:5051-Heterococcus_DN1.PRE.4